MPDVLGMPQTHPPTANRSDRLSGTAEQEVTAVGVDGWRGRWVAAEVRGRRIVWTVHQDFAALAGYEPYRQARIAVDIPIGLLADGGSRACDIAARAIAVGAAASVFPAPSRRMLARWRSGQPYAPGLGLSAQAWNLIPAVSQVDEVMTPTWQSRVTETHPECSFRAMGLPVDATKKTGRGVGQRLQALRAGFDFDLAAAPSGPAVDDLLDAAAAAWTAQRWRVGRAITLPADSPARRDERELLMQIRY